MLRASEIAARDRLEIRHPDAQIWSVRIGSRHVCRFDGRTNVTEGRISLTFPRIVDS